MSQIKDNLKFLLCRKNWSAQELARRSNLKDCVIYNILHGRTQRPSYDKVQAIATAFGINASYLLFANSNVIILDDYLEDIDDRLYSDSIELVSNTMIKLGKNPKNTDVRQRALLYFTMRVYKFAKRKNTNIPDLFFAEDIIYYSPN